MRYPIPLLVFSLVIAGCDNLPRDAAGSTEQIERQGQLRVAVLPDTPDPQPALDMLSRYAAAHNARISFASAHGEHALRMLQDGELDAVVGHFAEASPWKADIALSKAVTRAEPENRDEPALRIARRNGENAFILATDRAIARGAQ